MFRQVWLVWNYSNMIRIWYFFIMFSVFTLWKVMPIIALTLLLMFLVILYPLIVEMNPNMASYTSELPNKRMVMFLDSIVNHLPLFLRWSLTFVNTNWMSEEYHIVVFSSLSHVEMLSTSFFMVTWYISQAYYSYYSSIIIIFIPCTLCVAKWFYHLHWLVD